MITLPLIIASLSGVLLSQIGIFIAGNSSYRSQLQQAATLWSMFVHAADDDTRQNVLLRTGLTYLRLGLTILWLVFGAGALILTPLWLLDWTESQKTTYMLTLSLVAIGWSFLGWPRHTADVDVISPYNFLHRSLHWLALEPAVVRNMTFELGRYFAVPRPSNSNLPHATDSLIADDLAGGPVYVCGLARSGTTILLRILDQVEAFRSLTYRDMPFVLAPNIWQHITGRATLPSLPMQRAHGDGITVDFDSPEAFEEVFWRTLGTQSSSADTLSEEPPSPEVLAAFKDYQLMVCSVRKKVALPATEAPKRYLSKNNNNLLRLPSLCVDPAAAVLLVYRDPISTARSLHRMHLRFCAAQTQNRFTRRYMGWLGHYEFGLGHRPFAFAKPTMNAYLSPDGLDYWLDYWNAVHQHVLEQQDLPLKLVSYAALSEHPLMVLETLFQIINVQADVVALGGQIVASAPVVDPIDGFQPELLQRAMNTYRALLASPKNVFTPV